MIKMKESFEQYLRRYNQINKYAEKLIIEQETPPVEPTDPALVPDTPPATDSPATAPANAPLDPTATAPLPDESMAGTEEIDITDLVNMTRSIKNDLDNSQANNGEVMGKIEDVFSRLDILAQQLGQMNQLVAKIEDLGRKIDEVKPKTPQEKLEMRSLDSYPFSQKPNDFFVQKQVEMQQSGKNEYILTKNDAENYNPYNIKDSFNPIEDDNNEFEY